MICVEIKKRLISYTACDLCIFHNSDLDFTLSEVS